MDETKGREAKGLELAAAFGLVEDELDANLRGAASALVRVRRCLTRASDYDRARAIYVATKDEDGESVATSGSLMEREQAARWLRAAGLLIAGGIQMAMGTPAGGTPAVRAPHTLRDYQEALQLLTLAGVEWK